MHETRTRHAVPPGMMSRRAFAATIAASFLVMPLSGVADAAETPMLPGVPASVTVEAWLTLDLEGDYRWQSTKYLVGAEPTATFQVHRGFLVATDNPVEVSDPAFGIHDIPGGGALAMGEGQQMTIVAPKGDARLMFVELVSPDGAFPNEQPDSVKAFSVAKGRYTVAVLAVPGGPDAPKPAVVIAKAAAPAIAITPEGSGASGGGTTTWLVALFRTGAS